MFDPVQFKACLVEMMKLRQDELTNAELGYREHVLRREIRLLAELATGLEASSPANELVRLRAENAELRDELADCKAALDRRQGTE